MSAPHPRTDLLVQRARAGDVGAFERLYRLHVGRVYALCRRMEPAEAEELTQRAFVRAWEKLGGFRGESAFASWLHRIAINEILGERRRRGRARDRELAAREDAPTCSPPGRPGIGLDLERAIAGLPRRARQVLVLHDIEGYKHAEIAALMGISAGTSKGQLHRARRLLREAMSDER